MMTEKMKGKFSAIIILLICLQPHLFAQTEDYGSMQVVDYSNSRDFEIADITIAGVEFLQPQVLISISGLRIGDQISVPGDRLTEVIQKFWEQGLFADVKITA